MAVVIAAGLLVSSCAGMQTFVDGNAPMASRTASTLLKTVTLPHGAKQLSKSPNSLLDMPWSRPACTPLFDRAEWASAPGMSPAVLRDWLKANSPSLLTVDGSGELEKAGSIESLTLSGTWSGSYPKLMDPPKTTESVVALGSGAALRIDVMTIPKGAACARSGGGEGVKRSH